MQTIETKMMLQNLKIQGRQLDCKHDWRCQNGKDVAKVYNLQIFISQEFVALTNPKMGIP